MFAQVKLFSVLHSLDLNLYKNLIFVIFKYQLQRPLVSDYLNCPVYTTIQKFGVSKYIYIYIYIYIYFFFFI